MHRYKEYEQLVDDELEDGQSQIADFFRREESDSYSSRHPRQVSITDALITDLIIGCSLPLSLVENEHFRHFLYVMDNKYTPSARSTISTYLERKVNELKEKLKQDLKLADTVNATVDIWSDRKMRGYMATTVHYVAKISKTDFVMKSGLLAIERFTGSHTGEKIAAQFEAVVDMYGVRDKIDYIITDNAANMRKAFTVCFPKFEDDATAGTSGADNISDIDEGLLDVDDPDTWQALPNNEQALVNNIIDVTCKKARLSCFCHSLHLTVSDGLSDTKCVSTAIAKSSKLSSLLHQSTNFKDIFEKEFGKNKGIPASVNTRWNSTLRQINAVVDLDQQKLTSLLNEGHKNLIITTREWAQLKELCEILEPFLEATNSTQGNKTVTISYVLPYALQLRAHLQEWRINAKYCQPVVKALLTSLQNRFAGLFNRTAPPINRCHIPDDDKFGNDIYLIAAVLHPKFCLKWLADVDGSAMEKEAIRREVTGKLLNNYLLIEDKT